MTPKLLLQFGSPFALLAFANGCASLSPPFNQMKTAPMTVAVLQNYQAPAASASAPATPAAGISQIIQQGLAQVQQWIPGLTLPPGLIPGSQAPAPVQPTPEQDPTKYFHGYFILSFKQVVDSGTQSDIATLFGTSSDFNSSPGTCFFPNLGFSIAQPNGQPPADILVSLSPCSQARAFNITWPYGGNLGIQPDTEKNIDAIVRKVFQGT